MTYAGPLLILAAVVGLTWFCCLRPMRNSGHGCCLPTQERTDEIEALRREIAHLRRSRD